MKKKKIGRLPHPPQVGAVACAKIEPSALTVGNGGRRLRGSAASQKPRPARRLPTASNQSSVPPPPPDSKLPFPVRYSAAAGGTRRSRQAVLRSTEHPLGHWTVGGGRLMPGRQVAFSPPRARFGPSLFHVFDVSNRGPWWVNTNYGVHSFFLRNAPRNSPSTKQKIDDSNQRSTQTCLNQTLY